LEGVGSVVVEIAVDAAAEVLRGATRSSGN